MMKNFAKKILCTLLLTFSPSLWGAECGKTAYEGVPFESQQGIYDCWLASISMLVKWRDPSQGDDLQARLKEYLAPNQQWNELVACEADCQWATVSEATGLTVAELDLEQEHAITAEQISELLQTSGPLMISLMKSEECSPTCKHLVVVTGITDLEDASDSDPTITIHDPWQFIDNDPQNGIHADPQPIEMPFSEFQERCNQLRSESPELFKVLHN